MQFKVASYFGTFAPLFDPPLVTYLDTLHMHIGLIKKIFGVQLLQLFKMLASLRENQNFSFFGHFSNVISLAIIDFWEKSFCTAVSKHKCFNMTWQAHTSTNPNSATKAQSFLWKLDLTIFIMQFYWDPSFSYSILVLLVILVIDQGWGIRLGPKVSVIGDVREYGILYTINDK